MTKNQTIELLKQQLPGFYSVEQVIEIINGIEEDTQTSILNETQFEELKDELYTVIDRALARVNSNELVDFDSADFYLDNGNKIVLDNIDVNTDEIAEIATNAIESLLEHLLTNKQI